ncbi:geranylgeranylglycerol-phosphate geranylgeranyltransferase [Thermococci archaeon]|uniref:geranylgeranylglycerol-phosphate geranylgeranyltransferase n=1 Tax=Palaeococcus sp. (in: euryarchaeotes) TaxID=2820298 RepID=UPI000F2221DC|nr:geranylgeranylglycerol-phosphate geranylgeranyltransferase [Palaeococcus sp. (in: euryarchaeotes)]MCD6558472.1 geranylgeranylglycerol-phosphate geranylgeranyltransferase [Palaeococcus sp. (in: euryarchaeotes)]RLF77303.1 MAG: geranylgeranylglycerol-phosphate geranylgeranyltransferase [Thermococci archaeon]RLF89527.1 MAG: geranylgeranylglycerol-phosphate geranylgeranyltransferase [Thermococci archaeon]
MQLKPFIEITRPHNCILAGIVGVLGSMVAIGTYPPWIKALLTFLVVSLGCSGGNTINDYFDYEIDKINRPTRPLPRGAMTREAALIYAFFLFLVGLLLAYTINRYAFFVASMAYALMVLYAWKLKPLPFIGNIVVAFLTGITPIYGALAVEKIGFSGYLALSAFLVNVAREVMKDMEDIEGDKAKGARTLPIILGHRNAAYIAAFFTLLTVISSFLPLMVGIGMGYVPILLVDLILLKAMWDILKDPSPSTAGKSQKKLKIAILLAVLSFLMGSITSTSEVGL